MTSAEELQRLLYQTLMADTAVMALAYRVYDHVPTTNEYGGKTSYISFGSTNSVEDDADCITGVRTTIQLDVWSTSTVGALECKKLTDLVRRALHRKTLSLTDNALVDIRVPLTRVFPDPSGEHHGVVQVECMIEEPS